MPTTELVQVVQGTQNLVTKEFNNEEKAVSGTPSWVAALRLIADSPDDAVKACLGDAGKKIKKFTSRVNLNHPDLEVFVNSLPKCAVEMFRTCADAIKNSKDASGTAISVVSEEAFAGKWGTDGKTVLRSLMQPRTRLLLSSHERIEQRNVKKMPKNIGLKTILSTGENSFFGRPENFNRFARNSKLGQEELTELGKRQEKFASLNMPELADSYSKRMKNLQESLGDYFGFFRIRPDEAAITLARLHNFRWSENGSVVIPSKYFGDFQFWTEAKSLSNVTDAKIEAIKKTLVLNTRFAPTGCGVSNFQYQARMYPLPQFLSPPTLVRNIIEKVESFTALGGNPFFDYLWVLVPSIMINHPLIKHQKEVDEWILTDNSKEPHTFNDSMEAAAFLDGRLVENKLVYPIVIGERDGKCYFLCMWQ